MVIGSDDSTRQILLRVATGSDDSDDSDGVPIFIPIATVAGVIILVAGVIILLGIVWWQRGNLSMLKP